MKPSCQDHAREWVRNFVAFTAGASLGIARAGNPGSWMRDGTEGWKICTVDGEDDVVGRVQCDLAATIGSSVVGLEE